MSTRDAKGWPKRYSYFITADNADAGFSADVETVSQALEAAILSLTNAAESVRPTTSGGQSVLDLAYGANSEYPQNWNQARMMFLTAKGTKAIFGIGAPKIAIFDTDGTTVLNDGTQAAVVAYVAAVKTASGTAFVSTQGGLAFAHFAGGILKIGRQPRRFNELIKSSHLVVGEGE
jgi:hypothetical protein